MECNSCFRQQFAANIVSLVDIDSVLSIVFFRICEYVVKVAPHWKCQTSGLPNHLQGFFFSWNPPLADPCMWRSFRGIFILVCNACVGIGQMGLKHFKSHLTQFTALNRSQHFSFMFFYCFCDSASFSLFSLNKYMSVFCSLLPHLKISTSVSLTAFAFLFLIINAC